MREDDAITISHIPEWARWLAQDADGAWHVFAANQQVFGNTWIYDKQPYDVSRGARTPVCISGWQNSLVDLSS